MRAGAEHLAPAPGFSVDMKRHRPLAADLDVRTSPHQQPGPFTQGAPEECGKAHDQSKTGLRLHHHEFQDAIVEARAWSDLGTVAVLARVGDGDEDG